MISSQSSDEVAIVCIGKRKRSNVIADSDSEVGKTHLRKLTVDQIDKDEVKFIQDDADGFYGLADEANSKS